MIKKADLGSAGNLMETSYFWHGYENLIVNEFAGRGDYGDKVIQDAVFDINCKGGNILSLLLMFVILRGLGFACLVFVKHDK